MQVSNLPPRELWGCGDKTPPQSLSSASPWGSTWCNRSWEAFQVEEHLSRPAGWSGTWASGEPILLTCQHERYRARGLQRGWLRIQLPGSSWEFLSEIWTFSSGRENPGLRSISLLPFGTSHAGRWVRRRVWVIALAGALKHHFYLLHVWVAQARFSPLTPLTGSPSSMGRGYALIKVADRGWIQPRLSWAKVAPVCAC